MRKLLNVVSDDLKKGENLDVYVSIPLTLIIAILGIIGIVGFQILSAAILLILGLLAGSLLITRKAVTRSIQYSGKISQKLENLRSAVNSPRASEIFRREYPNFANSLSNAKAVSILGFSLGSAATRYFLELQKALERRCSLRFILCEPTPAVVDMLVFRSSSYDFDNREDLQTMVKLNFRRYTSRLKSLVQNHSDGVIAEVRTLQCLPPYGLVIIEDINGQKKLFLKLMVFRATDGQYPTMEFDSLKDGTWVDFFQAQFEKIWQSALPLGS